jgi:hypothetical protein
MVIPRCARCFGIFIFWKSIVKKEVTYSITAIHVPPGKRSYIKSVSKELLKRVPKDVPSGEPYHIIFGGGKINTPQNRFFYKNSIRGYILPLQRKYPSIEINLFEVKDNTFFTTMFLSKDGEISAKNYYPKS